MRDYFLNARVLFVFLAPFLVSLESHAQRWMFIMFSQCEQSVGNLAPSEIFVWRNDK